MIQENKKCSAKEYPLRYVLRLILEGETPLAIGSGNSDLLTDSPVCLDANGLPYIPGTSITGVLRHAFSKEDKNIEDKIFGFHNEKASENSEGSRLLLSNGYLIDKDGPLEGLVDPNRVKESEFLAELSTLCIREHCSINHYGTSPLHGKFDNQVIPKGVRFLLEMELIGNKEDEKAWDTLLNLFHHPLFRIGGGTRKGLGKLLIIPEKSSTRIYNLENSKDLNDYLEKSSSLKEPLAGATLLKKDIDAFQNDDYYVYSLILTPENSWIFGSGFGDEEADHTPIYEKEIEWDELNRPSFSDKKILISTSSIKGAISHRVAFHYNKFKGIFADQIDKADLEKKVGENNKAVFYLFGNAKEATGGRIGNVIFSDVLIPNKNETKIFNHVSIDRFTGGARKHFLFDEKVLIQKEFPLSLEILVLKKAFVENHEEGPNIKEAFETTLEDICKGRLPLGGSVMRGHGVFQGSWK